MIILKIIKVILGFLGLVAILPSALLFPALIITAIIGAVKHNFTALKTYLKIWGYSLLGLIGVLVLYAIVQFVLVKVSV